jgi:hypothetical protein
MSGAFKELGEIVIGGVLLILCLPALLIILLVMAIIEALPLFIGFVALLLIAQALGLL